MNKLALAVGAVALAAQAVGGGGRGNRMTGLETGILTAGIVDADGGEERRNGVSPKHESHDADYKTVNEIAAILRCHPKTVSKWIRDFGLGTRHGVLRFPNRMLIYWPTFEREFVQKMGPDGVEQFIKIVNEIVPKKGDE